MGNMRKNAFLAVSALLLLGGSTTAFSQSAQMIDEIARKAEAAEPEGGFCSRTGWPKGDNWEGFRSFLLTAAVGTWKVNTFANGSCELNRVTDVSQKGGTRCVTYSIWVCKPGTDCGTGKVVDCLDRNGKLERKEN